MRLSWTIVWLKKILGSCVLFWKILPTVLSLMWLSILPRLYLSNSCPRRMQNLDYLGRFCSYKSLIVRFGVKRILRTQLLATYLGSLQKKRVSSLFLSAHLISSYAIIAYFLVTGEMPLGWRKHDKHWVFYLAKFFYWDDHYLFKYCFDQSFRGRSLTIILGVSFLSSQPNL